LSVNRFTGALAAQTDAFILRGLQGLAEFAIEPACGGQKNIATVALE
jgi:hypothetical protein